MTSKKYNMGFTSSGLLVRESQLLAERYLELNDWKVVRSEAVEKNLFRSRTPETAKRIAREVVLRLKELDLQELEKVVHGRDDEIRQLLWVAVCRRYQFIADFAREVLHEHFLQFKPEITEDDYQVFFNRKAAWHEELEQLSRISEAKIKQVLFRMMREAGLLDAENRIIPTLFSDDIRRLTANIPNQLELFATR